MTDAPKLKFGETPFDKMSHEELLRTCQRMYAALYQSKSALETISSNFPESTYLTDPRAQGGRALELVRQILEPIWEEYSEINTPAWTGRDTIYYNFYSYGMGLLFSSKTKDGIEMGMGWNVCINPDCQTWSGTNPWNPKPPTSCPMCDGDIRPLTWDDMKPVASDQEGKP